MQDDWRPQKKGWAGALKKPQFLIVQPISVRAGRPVEERPTAALQRHMLLKK